MRNAALQFLGFMPPRIKKSFCSLHTSLIPTDPCISAKAECLLAPFGSAKSAGIREVSATYTAISKSTSPEALTKHILRTSEAQSVLKNTLENRSSEIVFGEERMNTSTIKFINRINKGR